MNAETLGVVWTGSGECTDRDDPTTIIVTIVVAKVEVKDESSTVYSITDNAGSL